jgi:hypothetical protein
MKRLLSYTILAALFLSVFMNCAQSITIQVLRAEVSNLKSLVAAGR